MASKGLRYSNFAHRIDLDELYAAINFSPDDQDNRGNDIGQCPLPLGLHAHGDTTGKFAIHRDKRVYNCWVCGGGSLLDLAMHMNDMDDHEATEWLYQFTKASEERSEEFVQRVKEMMADDTREKPGDPYYNERVIEKWIDPDHPWFEERGIPREVAEYFKLGFNPHNRKYTPKRGGSPIDEPFEGPAIVLPHFFKGRLQGWQVRWLTDDRPKWVKKYDNNNDFPRQTTLWGYDFASKQNKPPVVVESVPTALFLIGLGYPSVASFGAVVNDAQIKLLRAFQQGVILAPDKGSVGHENYWKAAGKLQRFVPVAWAEPPEILEDKEDLGDLVNDHTSVCRAIDEAKVLFSTK